MLLLEHAERLGKKILISGGGRCNFTNINAGPANYLSANRHFCKSALARYTPGDFIALVEKHGIAYHEKKLGQLFCDLRSRQIVEMLQAECDAAQVEIRLNCGIKEVGEIAKPANLDFVQRGSPKMTPLPGRNRSRVFECDSVVVATGGLSFPKIGATDLGYRIARQFGIKMTATQPGLVPLTFGAREQRAFGPLSGISLDVTASCNGASASAKTFC